MPTRKIKKKIQPVEAKKNGRKIKVKKDKFAEDEAEAGEEAGKVAGAGAEQAAKRITSRKFKVAKPKSILESEGEDSLAEGGEAKIAPTTKEDVKNIKLKRKVKRKK